MISACVYLRTYLFHLHVDIRFYFEETKNNTEGVPNPPLSPVTSILHYRTP